MPAVPALDDSELLAALGRGDPSAATALHDRLRPQVDRTVRRLLGSSDPDLCDVEQQAMIEVVLTVATYRGDCSLDSWTSAVAAHVVYKHIRRRKVERRIFGRLDADLFLEVRSPSRTGREALVRSMLRRVLTHLDAVDEVKAWAFVLHDVCGYDLRGDRAHHGRERRRGADTADSRASRGARAHRRGPGARQSARVDRGLAMTVTPLCASGQHAPLADRFGGAPDARTRRARANRSRRLRGPSRPVGDGARRGGGARRLRRRAEWWPSPRSEGTGSRRAARRLWWPSLRPPRPWPRSWPIR